jgi:hypothetical protein
MGTEDDLTSQNEEEMLMRRAIVLTIGVILALMVAAPLASATQAAQDGTLQARVGKLGATWWQWAGSDPTATNSVVGSYSYKAEVGAIKCDGSNPRAAWFLAGTADGSAVTRDCRAPADTRIFFPINTFVCGPAWSDPFNTEEELRAECNGLVDAALEGATPYATVDGKQVRMVRADTRRSRRPCPRIIRSGSSVARASRWRMASGWYFRGAFLTAGTRSGSGERSPTPSIPAPPSPRTTPTISR